MDTTGIMRWSELKGLEVSVPSEGRKVGVVEDFYYEPGTNAIDALKVRTRLGEELTLPANETLAIERSAVSIKSAQALTKRKSPHVLGSTLISMVVKSEKESEVGVVADVLLGVDPPITLRVVGIELADRLGNRSRQPKLVDANAIQVGEHQSIVIENQVARRL